MKHPSNPFLRPLLQAAFLAAGLAFALPVLAQEDVPPPPEGEAAPADTTAPTDTTAPADAAAPADNAAVAAPMVPTPTPTHPKFQDPQEAYRYQSGRLKDQEKGLEDKSKGLDKDQYEVWSKVKGITQYPSVSVHGVGRMLALSTQFYGNYGPQLSFSNPGLRRGSAFLDLQPMGSVSKPVRWSAVIRFTSNLQTGSLQESMDMLRATLEFNPDFLSATLGDFNEAYTPLSLWNRDSLDLKYVPEMAARWNDHLKYESFLDEEPTFPFRGLRVGTDLLWPEDPILDRFGVSAFAHIVRNGYNDTGDGTTFFGPYKFTDWIFAGKTSLKSRKWDLEGTSLQVSLEAYGVMLDQILGTDTPGSPYNANDSSTWARQYLTGSLNPEVRVGFGGDLYLGGLVALATSSFQDDKIRSDRVVSDYAFLGGPYLQAGPSRLGFNFLDVGPSYFAPLAQMRQDRLSVIAPDFGYLQSPFYFRPLLREQQLFSSVSRPSGFLTFYDRTLDNVFPYGLATPNREGFGLELDVQALERKAMKLRGSAYRVREINGNLVVNQAQTGYAPVEDPTVSVVPMREFVHVNAGGSLNLGPLVGWDRDAEIGANVRYEDTWSQLGELSSLWVVGGVRVQVLAFCQVSGSMGYRTVSGQEAGHSGTQWARTPYIYDNGDLGSYSVVDMGGRAVDYSLSLLFNIDLHSKLAVDYSLVYGDLHPYQPSAGDLYNQFMGLSYEIEF